MNNLLLVNTRTKKIEVESCTDEQRLTGGRSFIAHYMLGNSDPACEPLGRKSKFIVASGLLGDTALTTSGRSSVGGKSPLTGGIKESNVGGAAGRKLANLGFRAIILEDMPQEPSTGVLYVKNGEAEIISFPGLKGREVSDTFDMLFEKFGKNVGVYCIGPAGEMGLASACVATTDHTGQQLRVAGRGGMGAVMGSKGIKAIVIDDSDKKKPDIYDKKALSSAAREVAKIIREDPKTENRHDFGTPAVLSMCNSLGILPTRNFSSGSFEDADKISGEKVAELIIKRGGDAKRGLPCVRGCSIKCSNIFADKNGKKLVASLQYENIALLGSNCGISDIDAIAILNDRCNQVGVDTIETGACIGVAMEAGLVEFGDSDGARDLIDQIARGTYLGRIIGSGVSVTGKVLNIKRIPAVKGQAMPAYDPRSLKGIGVTYSSSAMGADHTAGNALEMAKFMDPAARDGQIEVSLRLQIRGVILDSLGVCLFIRPAFVKDPGLVARLINAKYGTDYHYPDIQKMAIDCLKAERKFNDLAGLPADRCDIPEFMREEPLPPKNNVFDIPRGEIEDIFKVKVPAEIF
jgi:aldehyde:ferredoxin oxidoreductase